jgi:hypothetical protein
VSHASNAGKIMAVAKKVGVTEEDFDRVMEDIRKATPPKYFDDLLKDFSRLRP